MGMMECALGITHKRFPTGTISLNVSDRDREWLGNSKLTVSGWEYPLLITKRATGSGEGAVEYGSLARAILEKYGFHVPDDNYVLRVDPTDTFNVNHDNLYIPESLIPEFPLNSNYQITLGSYLQGLDEAAVRCQDEYVVATCIEEGTRAVHRFFCDPEDRIFIDGTKVKFSERGQPLFFCEDLKFRSIVQEFVRRGTLGVSFSEHAFFRRLSDSVYDLRKSQIAVMRTTRKEGR